MLTTHSPAFIDLARDNTTVVRVERTSEGKIHGTTVFRPQTVKLSNDEKEELKLLNLFDPYVAEFFFGGQTILVEGDTEFTALKYATQSLGENEVRNLHVVRARGKVTIGLLCKILNQFNAKYAVLHDADSPTALRKGNEIVNPAWTNNGKILVEVKASKDAARIRLCASIPDFEGAVFGTVSDKEKPYTAFVTLRENPEMVQKTNDLLKALIDFSAPLPDGFVQWGDLGALKKIVLEAGAKG
jgi:putative ATP-dependent endonuclease of OLD family